MDFEKLSLFINQTGKIQDSLLKLWVKRINLYSEISNSNLHKIKKKLSIINKTESKILDLILNNSISTLDFIEKSKSESLKIYDFSIHEKYISEIIKIQKDFLEIEKKFITDKLNPLDFKKLKEKSSTLINFTIQYSKETKEVNIQELDISRINNVPIENSDLKQKLLKLNDDLKDISNHLKPKRYWIDRTQAAKPLGSWDERANFNIARFPEIIAALFWRMGLVFPTVMGLNQFIDLNSVNIQIGFVEGNLGALIYGIIAAVIEIMLGLGKYTIEFSEKIYRSYFNNTNKSI